MAVACRAMLGTSTPQPDKAADGEAKPANVPPHHRMRCDAVELGRVDGDAASLLPASRSIPANIRRAVLARDHHRCRVPGCTNTIVDVHHIVPWSASRNHDPLNLLTTCELHHSHQHEGIICISGTADALVITHRDGRPYGMPSPPSLLVDEAFAAASHVGRDQLGDQAPRSTNARSCMIT
jgi:hypothetical protein